MRSLLASSLLFALAAPLAADWPAFRGPRGDGIADEQALPADLGAENILWKVKLPGLGSSSPITYGNRVFVTAYTGYGTTVSKGMGGGFGKGGFGKGGFGKGGFGKGGFGKGGDTGDQKDLRLLVLCLNRDNGEILWTKEVQPKLPEMGWTGFIREHGYASSTPVTDGQAVYVFFGKTGVLAFDMEGEQHWQTSVGTRADKWGSGASPVLYNDLVIVNAAIESGSLVALDKRTGKEVWRARGIATNWVTPIVVETKEGKDELVLSLPGKVVGYDPEKGTELWRCEGIGRPGGMGYTSSSPVARDGIVYVIGGGGPSTPAAALAVKAGGRGNVDETHVLWRARAGTSNASPVLVGDRLCFIAGSATCLKTSDGKVERLERLYDGRGEYVSPVVAGDKVYALTRFDGLFVLSGNDKLAKVGHLEFAGDRSVFNASPAVSEGRMYVRSNEFLYCLGEK